VPGRTNKSRVRQVGAQGRWSEAVPGPQSKAREVTTAGAPESAPTHKGLNQRRRPQGPGLSNTAPPSTHPSLHKVKPSSPKNKHAFPEASSRGSGGPSPLRVPLGQVPKKVPVESRYLRASMAAWAPPRPLHVFESSVVRSADRRSGKQSLSDLRAALEASTGVGMSSETVG